LCYMRQLSQMALGALSALELSAESA